MIPEILNEGFAVQSKHAAELGHYSSLHSEHPNDTDEEGRVQTVKLAIDLETGELMPARSLLFLAEADFSRLRREAMTARITRRRGNPDAVRFQCAICKTPLYLSRHIGGTRNRWFTHDEKSPHCPWSEGSHLSPDLTRALIYRGQQEGAKHRALKQFIAHWLAEDELVSGICQEQTTFGEVLKGNWRRPDVKCLYRGKPVVFEIQLSYTFLSDVLERDAFYRAEGIFIVWVFAQFDLQRAAVTDEAYFNHRNLFILDAAALDQTVVTQTLTFSGYHQIPQVKGSRVQDVWTSKCVNLKSTEFPADTFRPYFFNYEAERKHCLTNAHDGQMREDFRKYWLQQVDDDVQWHALWIRFCENGIEVPRYVGSCEKFRAFFDTLYSAKEGSPVGWRHDSLVKIAHHVFDKYKGQLWAFKLMLKAHDRGDQIRCDDVSRNWRDKKVKLYTAAWKDRDSEFAPDRRFDQLIAFLFPEIGHDLQMQPR